MRSPALAIGWELWARHRWGVTAVGGVLLVAAAACQVLRAGGALRTIGVLAYLSFFLAYLYLLSIFIYSQGTIGGKVVGFPPHLFTLPMSTALLVGWPMLFGMATVALLWFGLSWLILIPAGFMITVPWWPALLMAAFLTTTQAICWTIVRSHLLRIVVVILGLPFLILTALLIWANYNLSVTLTQSALGLCAIIVLAYISAVSGVARDRCGDRLGWAWLGRLLLVAVPRLPDRERFFASAMSAQVWLEVRRHAWLLPTFVGMFLLLLLFWATALPLDATDVARCAAAIVGVPLGLAFFIGFGMGKNSFWAQDLHLSSFVAIRPLSSAALAGAKLRAAALSALATWGTVLILSPAWAVVSGNVGVIRDLSNAVFHDQPAWKLWLLAPVALTGLVGLTWLQIVAGMCLSLTGRAWVVNAMVLLYGAIGSTLIGLVIWNSVDPEFTGTLVVLWSLGSALGALKLCVAAWTCSLRDLWNGTDLQSVRHDRVPARLAVWLGIAACLLLPLYALVPEGPVPNTTAQVRFDNMNRSPGGKTDDRSGSR
jgi:hypothetical protein